MAAPHEALGEQHLYSMPALVNMSCRMADAAGLPAFPGCCPEPYKQLLAQLPERERRLFFSDIGTLVFAINKKIHAIESI